MIAGESVEEFAPGRLPEMRLEIYARSVARFGRSGALIAQTARLRVQSAAKFAATGVSMTGKLDISAAMTTAAVATIMAAIIRGAATVTIAVGLARRPIQSSVIAAGVGDAINYSQRSEPT